MQMVNTLVTTTLWREPMYEYKCKVVHIVDGDTVDVDIEDTRIRGYDINTSTLN